MTRLLTMAVIRNPKPAPPVRPDDPVVLTHPPSSVVTAAKGRESLHDALHAAWQDRDWHGLAALARRHLETIGKTGPQLHPITQAAIAFLRPNEIDASEQDLRSFMAGFSPESLKEYRAGADAADRNGLADYALALHCTGLLGEAKIDPIGGLRALATFDAMAKIVTLRGPEARRPLRPILDWVITVLLPQWTFEIDICGEPHLVLHGPEPTPLELRLANMDRLRAQATGNCDCKPGRPVCEPQSVCCPELRYFLTDLLELRDWTHGYVAGDLAYIEVVGAGEFRGREHMFQRTREVFSETEQTVRSLDKRDHQVTDSSSLKREIERQTEASQSGDASVEGSYDAGVYKVSASAKLSYEKTASQSIKEAQEQARQVVTSAVSEIEKQVKTLRSERVTTEETERNVHNWDNSAGESAKVTKYFWVTKRQRAQLYSYGKRLMMELIVPSPARLYERLVADRIDAEVRRRVPPFTLTDPTAPDPLTIGASDLTPDNYLQQAQLFGVGNPPAPPADTVYVAASDSYGEVKNNVTSVGKLTVTVPDGYHAVEMVLSGDASYRDPKWHNTNQGRWVRFSLGGTLWFGSAGDSLTASLPDLTGTLSVDVSAANITGCQATITIRCVADAATMVAWQQSVFDLISAAYADKVTAYNIAKKAYDEAKVEHDAAEDAVRRELRDGGQQRHPFFNRALEKTELKRAAIYLMCENFSAESAWLRMAEPCGLPEIDRHATAERGYGWYFWDRVFDWKYMAYAFFDYFWNPICDWGERFDPDNADALFKAFLGAGYARLLIPVSPGMEPDFLWYSATLQKWGQTGEPPLGNDPRWRNVLYELKYANECAMTPREGHLENVAPGDLTVLLKGTDRYWSSLSGQVDPVAVAADVDREIFIDGEVYLVADIQPEPGSPPFTNNNDMWWRVTLDRPYEGTASARRLYSFGAQAVAPAFTFDVPTELIWAGAHDDCLPTYPLPPC